MLLRLIFVLCLGLTPGVTLAQNAFSAGGPTVSLAVTGTTGRVQYQPGTSGSTIRVYNTGTVAAFIVCGEATVVATTAAGIPIAPGSVEVLGCQGATYVAAITASGTATIYVTPGAGI